jgi:hypothetical protein
MTDPALLYFSQKQKRLFSYKISSLDHSWNHNWGWQVYFADFSLSKKSSIFSPNNLTLFFDLKFRDFTRYFWQVGPVSNAGKVTASGRGLQPHGLRALEPVDFKVRALFFPRLTLFRPPPVFVNIQFLFTSSTVFTYCVFWLLSCSEFALCLQVISCLYENTNPSAVFISYSATYCIFEASRYKLYL